MRRRSFPHRLIRFPAVFAHHYTLLRRYHGRRVSARDAFKLARLILV